MPPEQAIEEEVTIDPTAQEAEGEETTVASEGDSEMFGELHEELNALDAADEPDSSSLFEEDVTEEVAEAAPAEPEVPEGKKAQAAVEETAETEAEPETTTDESQPEGEEAPEPDPVVQEEESEPEETPEPEPSESYETLRAEALEELQTDFAIDEDDAQLLVTEPEKVLPKLAANLYMKAYENIVKTVNASLPEMIASTIAQKSAADEATDTFYSKWDKLSRGNKKHSETVNRIGLVYRQMNPDAPTDQFIAEVGAQALLALGIPFEEIIDAPQEEKPFTPAAPSAAAPAPEPPRAVGQFETLANEFIEDDS